MGCMTEWQLDTFGTELFRLYQKTILQKVYYIAVNIIRCMMTLDLMKLDDSWWHLMMLDDSWWRLMMLDETWWHLMTLDDACWCLMTLANVLWLFKMLDDTWWWLMMPNLNTMLVVKLLLQQRTIMNVHLQLTQVY